MRATPGGPPSAHVADEYGEETGLAGPIKAISFDLWDTMIEDESDEPKRAAQGLRSKRDERRHLVFEAVSRHGEITADTVETAYNVADAAFSKAWKEHHVTWTVRERLHVLLGGLGRHLPGDAFDALVRAHEVMEIDVAPDAVAGIGDALAALAGRYRLCVVSDAIVSPGRVLRELLDHHGLLKHFEAFAFSDELGCSKPDARMFHAVAEQLGVDLAEMVHVGDRDHNDVKGPQALGMKAVLFTAIRDVDEKTTSADAVCRDHADLPAIIDRLA
jgi:putative hydrolase of the HAD superfamily